MFCFIPGDLLSITFQLPFSLFFLNLFVSIPILKMSGGNRDFKAVNMFTSDYERSFFFFMSLNYSRQAMEICM